MKSNYLRACRLPLLAGSVMAVAGCVVEPIRRPAVVVAPAPPMVEVEPGWVPDAYVWDGYEYVGIVGNQYYYLGPGNVWLLAEPFRLERFHGWERHHHDWREHAIRNERYRTDHYGRVHPWREQEPRREEHRQDERERDAR